MRYIWIDILRAIAILVVIFHHIIWPQIKPLTTPFIFGNGGYMAVSLFFVLSGFVISLPYFLGKRECKTRADIWKFYKHRFFRLYPLFIISALISVIFISGFSPKIFKELIFSWTAMGSFLPNYFFPSINPVYWSLMLEVLMSIIFPFILLFSRKISIIKIVLGFVIIAYFVQFFGWKIPFENPHTTPFRDNIFGHLDEFSFGILLAFLTIKKKILLSKKFIFVWLGVLFAWIIIADSARYGQFFTLAWKPDLWLVSARNIFLLLAWGCIILGALHIKKFPKYFIFIGQMCFSLYIWHMFFALFFEKFFGGVYGIPTTIIYLFITFFVSFLSFEYIEKRLGNYLSKKFS